MINVSRSVAAARLFRFGTRTPAQRFCSTKPRPDWHDAWQTFSTEVADLSTQINVIQSTFTKALFGMAGLTILFVWMEYQARTGIQMDMEVT